MHWLTLLASSISLSATNYIVGTSIGLEPMHLQIMLNVANIIGIFRSWYYDNHNLKGGKFLPFIQKSALPALAGMTWGRDNIWTYRVIYSCFTVIGLFTGMFYPYIYESRGLKSDYSVLYDDAIRNNLFEVLIFWSAIGAELLDAMKIIRTARELSGNEKLLLIRVKSDWLKNAQEN